MGMGTIWLYICSGDGWIKCGDGRNKKEKKEKDVREASLRTRTREEG